MNDIVIVISAGVLIFGTCICITSHCLKRKTPENIIYTTEEGNKRVEI